MTTTSPNISSKDVSLKTIKTLRRGANREGFLGSGIRKNLKNRIRGENKVIVNQMTDRYILSTRVITSVIIDLPISQRFLQLISTNFLNKLFIIL